MKRVGGFSLVEAILGIALIGIGLVGILFAFQGAAQSSLLADQTVIASHLARETMERIMVQRLCTGGTCGYANVLTSIVGGSYNANPVSGFAGYVLTTTRTEVSPDDDNSTDDFLDASGGSGYARITVTVSFNGGSDQVKLETLIANY